MRTGTLISLMFSWIFSSLLKTSSYSGSEPPLKGARRCRGLSPCVRGGRNFLQHSHAPGNPPPARAGVLPRPVAA